MEAEEAPTYQLIDLLSIVKEVFTMKSLPPIVEDRFGDALREREREIALQAEERGQERGEVRGEVAGTRATLLRLCSKRLGAPSAQVVERLESIENIEELYALVDR